MTNSKRLISFILRRDRVRILIWLISIVGFTLLIAGAFVEMFPTQQERDMMAETLMNPAMVAMLGPTYGDEYTVGVMFAHEMLLFSAIAVAIMNILFISRHTRKDEELGRLEVIMSLPVGRLANLGSTFIVAIGINLIIAIVTGFGIFALSIESMGLEGSLLYGFCLGVTGLFFGAVTAIFAQVSESSMGATGLSFMILILAYLVRAVGDVSSEVLSFLSPFGLAFRAYVYYKNNWWPIIILLVVTGMLGLLALCLNNARDLMSGLVPAKLGRRHASKFLKSPMGLVLRISRTSIIAWLIGIFVIGSSYGFSLGDLEGFFEKNEMFKSMLPENSDYSLTEQFITFIFVVMAMMSLVPVLQLLLKVRGEEKRNRNEHLLVRAVSRNSLLASYVIPSVVLAVLALFASVFGLWASSYTVMDTPIALGRMLSSGFVYLPAIIFFLSVAVFLVGVLPKATSFVWAYLGYAFLTSYLGSLLKLPKWMEKLSPFGFTPKIPVEEMKVINLMVILILSALFFIVGFIGFNKRDMQG